MTILDFGKRLGLLKEAWGFPINQTLANFLHHGKAENPEGKKLLYATVHRWTKSGLPSKNPYDPSSMASSFANYCKIEQKDGQSLKDKYAIDTDALFKALTDDDDFVFIDFVSRTSQQAPPITSRINAENNNISKFPKFFTQKLLMYRLGIDVERTRGGIVAGPSEYVLRRIPVEFYPIGESLRYREQYFLYDSEGHALRVRDYILIIGEDSENSDKSELFYASFEDEPIKANIHVGILAMKGDGYLPSAYRVALHSPPDKDDAKLDWEGFVGKYQKTYKLSEGDDNAITLKGDPIEKETGKNLNDFIKNYLSAKDRITGLVDLE